MKTSLSNKLLLCVAVLAVGILSETKVHAQPAVQAWVQRYIGSAESDDHARNVAVDSSGNVIVAGFSDWGGGRDWLIIKYSGAGVPLWTNRYEPGFDPVYRTALAVDGGGNVFVAGRSYYQYATIKYSSAGVLLWTNLYSGPGPGSDEATALAVDASGNVFVTGYSDDHVDNNSNWVSDWATIAYSEAGVPLWTNRYGGPADGADGASAIAVDGNGNVFVTGSARISNQYPDFSDYVTIKYSNAGVPLWTNLYTGTVDGTNGSVNGTDNASAIAVDGDGNVIVTGGSAGSGGFPYHYGDYATVKYSNDGLLLWVNRYNGPGRANAVAVDSSGNVFVTGQSDAGNYNYYGYVTIKYSRQGAPLWTNRYDDGPEGANAIAVDANGNVFVTGESYGGYAIVAYSGVGMPLWTNHYGNYSYWEGTLDATALALDGSGNAFVIASAPGNGGNSFDFATIKYSGTGVALWTNRYDAPANGADAPRAVAVDGSGNVFVTGTSPNTIFYPYSNDSATIKYSSPGVPLWTNRYSGSATALGVDGSGNVFVTGYWGDPYALPTSLPYDCVTVAYSSAGVPLWTNRHSGPGWWSYIPFSAAVAVDASGNVLVAETSQGAGSGFDYATIKYSNAGVPLWTNRYSGPPSYYGSASDDAPSSLALDSSGNVFVTGGSGRITNHVYFDKYATVAYSSAGVPLWTNLYDGPDSYNERATALAVDGSGNVFVTGFSGGGCATIKYSNAGVPAWTNYSGSCSAIAVDNNGNVFVTGGTATIKYSGAGVSLWTNYSESAIALAVDGSGNVFVTGSSVGNASGPDYATIKYSNAGVPLWTNRYNGLGNSADNALALAVDRNGDVVVTGSSVGCRTGADYVTIKYSSAGPLLTIARTATNTLALSWPSPAADFTLQQNANVASANWTPVGITPADDGTNKTVILERPEGDRFYRLARP